MREYPTDHIENRKHSPSQNLTVLEPRWTSALALVLSGIALGLSIMVVYVQATAYRELERESRLLQLKVDEFRMALITAGIDPNPHAEGESK